MLCIPSACCTCTAVPALLYLDSKAASVHIDSAEALSRFGRSDLVVDRRLDIFRA